MAVVDISNTFQMSKSGEHIDNTDVYNSNRNLLDNPWFTAENIVNQRGATSLVNGAIGIDRWHNETTSTNTITVGNGGLVASIPSGSVGIWQGIPSGLFNFMIGKTVTASALLSDGTIVSGTATVGSSGNTTFTSTAYDVNMLTQNAQQRFYCRIRKSATLVAVKLELGAYSTLANDVPPDYGEELAKCQRYFIRIKSRGTAAHIFGTGYATSNTNLRTLITLPVTMRSTPSSVFNGTFLVYGNGSNGLAVTNMTVGEVRENGIALGVTTSGLTANQTYHLTSQDSTAYLEFSADL